MAHILPETPPQFLPSETLRVFQSLKTLPDTFYIWHHLAPWSPNAPDFLAIRKDGAALLIKVSSAAASQALHPAQLLLLQDDTPRLGEAETATLMQFLQTVDLPEDAPLQTLVVFPNIPHRTLLQSRPERTDKQAQWAGSELLHPNTTPTWQDFFPTQPLSIAQIQRLREHFSPEIIINANMTVRKPNTQRLHAELTHYLLDYNQEVVVKNDLEMSTEGKDISRDFRLNIVNGVAGSGKTLILLYRLRLLYHLYPNKRFLVLTHNRALCHDMESRFHRLEGSTPESIEWQTFQGWCYRQWPQTPAWSSPISLNKQREIIRQVWQTTLKNTALSETQLLSEINWIKDQLPLSQQQYLNSDRRGRGFGLTEEQRLQIWNALNTYQRLLKEQGLMDWGDVPQAIWNFCQQGSITLPLYDGILIDEAQFFAPIWMHILQKALKPHTSHMFIVADPTQGFLGRKATWKSLGLEARGHTHLLRKSYRTTHEILQFATLFYRMRLPDEKDEDILPPQIENMPTGAFPQIIRLDSPQDEMSRVVNEIVALVKQGYPRKDILVLHANKSAAEKLIAALDHKLGKNAAMDPGSTYPGNYVRVTTLNAGAGLESPIVFLVGLRDIFEEEQSLRISDAEREEVMRDNTRKIYMAATRAGQRLVLTYVGDIPTLLQELGLKEYEPPPA